MLWETTADVVTINCCKIEDIRVLEHPPQHAIMHQRSCGSLRPLSNWATDIASIRSYKLVNMIINGQSCISYR
jgi:uncharacterized protein with FMN-binding domain